MDRYWEAEACKLTVRVDPSTFTALCPSTLDKRTRPMDEETRSPAESRSRADPAAAIEIRVALAERRPELGSRVTEDPPADRERLPTAVATVRPWVGSREIWL